MERLQKLLSHAGIASRRASEQLILDGRVTVNGAVVRTLGTKASLLDDDIRVDGRRVKPPSARRYVLLNKPAGVVTTRDDPQQRPTVMDLIGLSDYLYPVGRLDFDSEGLLLLTNDGELSSRLMHPRHAVPRVYEARVRGVPDAHDLRRLARGVMIDGRRTLPADVRLLPPARGERREDATLIITLHEGRNRQVRKMCEAIGHPVSALTRIAIGPIRDRTLKPGQWRDLTPSELERLKTSIATAPPPRLASSGGSGRSPAVHRRPERQRRTERR